MQQLPEIDLNNVASNLIGKISKILSLPDDVMDAEEKLMRVHMLQMKHEGNHGEANADFVKKSKKMADLQLFVLNDWRCPRSMNKTVWCIIDYLSNMIEDGSGMLVVDGAMTPKEIKESLRHTFAKNSYDGEGNVIKRTSIASSNMDLVWAYMRDRLGIVHESGGKANGKKKSSKSAAMYIMENGGVERVYFT